MDKTTQILRDVADERLLKKDAKPMLIEDGWLEMHLWIDRNPFAIDDYWRWKIQTRQTKPTILVNTGYNGRLVDAIFLNIIKGVRRASILIRLHNPETKSSMLKIGEVTVDSGMIFIGDPSYFNHPEKKPPALKSNWDEFVESLYQENAMSQFSQLYHEGGFKGFGVTARSGYGDGTYDVMAKMVNGLITKITIEFIK